MFNSTIKTVLATTFLVSAFTIGSANAGGGGGAGFLENDPAQPMASATLHNPDGSSITARSRKNKDGYYVIKRNKHGKVTSKRLVEKKKKIRVRKVKQPPFITLHNPDGSSRTVTISNGKRVVITHDANGNQTSWTQVQ